MPKASITAFYWWLIPKMFRSLRFMLCVITVYLGLAAIGSVCIDLFICFPVHYNWSLDYEKQGQSIWNSYTDFWINWTLNFSADIFCMLPYAYFLCVPVSVMPGRSGCDSTLALHVWYPGVRPP